MTYGWLSLPLLAGYFIASYTPQLQYLHRHLDRQRLIFHSAGIGVVLMALVLVLFETIDWFTPVNEQYLGNLCLASLEGFSVFAALLGGIGFIILHLVCWSEEQHEKQLFKAIFLEGTPLDQFLATAFKEQTTLLVTLDSGKVYVSYVISTPEPRGTLYVSIMPIWSGYRDENKEVNFTQNYSDVIRDDPNSLEVLIELKDITSFAKFSIDNFMDNDLDDDLDDDINDFLELLGPIKGPIDPDIVRSILEEFKPRSESDDPD